MDSKRVRGKEKNMIGFKKFINLTAQKKCPPGFRFDDKLKVCVPKGQGRYYGAYGFGVARNQNTSGETENGETENGNADTSNLSGNGNGKGNGGNGGNGGN